MQADSGVPTLTAIRLGTLRYGDAWALQRRLAVARRQGLVGDLVLLLEHPPVYTMGRNGRPEHVPGGPDRLRALGAEYWDVDRGGSVTFHGPGQLVAYPVVDLAATFPLRGSSGLGDVHRYVRALEEAMILTVSAAGIEATRRPPYTGVWVGGRKLAAIGVKLTSGVTTHGLALNVTTDLGWFEHIVACGIDGAGVCSMASLGAARSIEGVAGDLARALAVVFGRRLVQATEVPLPGCHPSLDPRPAAV